MGIWKSRYASGRLAAAMSVLAGINSVSASDARAAGEVIRATLSAPMTVDVTPGVVAETRISVSCSGTDPCAGQVELRASELVELESVVPAAGSGMTADGAAGLGNTITLRSAGMQPGEAVEVEVGVRWALGRGAIDSTGTIAVVDAAGTQTLTIRPHLDRSYELAAIPSGVPSPVPGASHPVHLRLNGAPTAATIDGGVVEMALPDGVTIADPDGGTITGNQISWSLDHPERIDPITGDAQQLRWRADPLLVWSPASFAEGEWTGLSDASITSSVQPAGASAAALSPALVEPRVVGAAPVQLSPLRLLNQSPVQPTIPPGTIQPLELTVGAASAGNFSVDIHADNGVALTRMATTLGPDLSAVYPLPDNVTVRIGSTDCVARRDEVEGCARHSAASTVGFDLTRLDSIKVHASVQIPSDAQPGDIIRITADVTAPDGTKRSVAATPIKVVAPASIRQVFAGVLPIGDVQPGATVVGSLAVYDRDPQTHLTAADVDLPVPDGLELVRLECEIESSRCPTITPGAVPHLRYDDVAGNAPRVFVTLKVLPTAPPGPLVIPATITGTPPVGTCETATMTLFTGPSGQPTCKTTIPSLNIRPLGAVALAVEGPEHVDPAEPATYRWMLANTGNATLNDVDIRLSIADPEWTINPSSVLVGTLPAGDVRTGHFTATAPPNAPSTTTITGRVLATTEDGTPLDAAPQTRSVSSAPSPTTTTSTTPATTTTTSTTPATTITTQPPSTTTTTPPPQSTVTTIPPAAPATTLPPTTSATQRPSVLTQSIDLLPRTGASIPGALASSVACLILGVALSRSATPKHSKGRP